LAPIQDGRHGRFCMLYPLRSVNLLISLEISLLQLPNSLITYRKSYMTIKLVTSNLTSNEVTIVKFACISWNITPTASTCINDL
jgi:hypothetical protein